MAALVSTRSSVRSARLALLGVGSLLSASLVGMSAANALPAGCVQVASTVTCTFDYTGGTQTWTAPTGVTSATVDLYGASGGDINVSVTGGNGAHVHAVLPVTPGSTYVVTVGQQGVATSADNGHDSAAGPAAYNGGGPGWADEPDFGSSAGGGGGTDLRATSGGLADRLLVAGGGGGAAFSGLIQSPFGTFTTGGGAGGASGTAGSTGQGVADAAGGIGGGAGSQSAGGLGGASSTSTIEEYVVTGSPGENGSLGQGGGAGTVLDPGAPPAGGGGGGYHGGGGGGEGAFGGLAMALGGFGGGGGGGGGSSFADPSATSPSVVQGDHHGDGQALITYTVPDGGGDTTAPSVTINQGSTQADPTGASPVVFDVVFSEPVTGFGDNDVSLSGTANATTAHVTGGGANYTVSVSGMSSNGTVIATVPIGGATDGTNLSSASTSTDNTVTYNGIDTTTPTVTINQAAGQADPTGTSPIVFDVVFSEPVTGFGDNDVSLSGTANATTAHVSGSGKNYTVSVSGMSSNGTVTATIPVGAATDGTNLSFDSTSTDNSVTYNGIDTTTPTVTINQGAGQADPTGTSPIVFDVVFSEPVTGFADGDVNLSGAANATTAHVTGSGANYTVSVSGMTGSGTVIATVLVGAATDGTNSSAASTSTDNTVTYNAAVAGLAPTITGLAQVGQTLTAHEGPVSPSDAALAYQWKANGTPIANATGSTYKLKAAQAGKTITVTITASKPPRTAQTETSDPTPYVRDKVTSDQLKLDRSTATRGGSLGLIGKGLTPGAVYQVAIGGTNLGSFTADEYGEINDTVTVPGSTKPGIQIVTITAPNGNVASAVILVK